MFNSTGVAALGRSSQKCLILSRKMMMKQKERRARGKWQTWTTWNRYVIPFYSNIGCIYGGLWFSLRIYWRKLEIYSLALGLRTLLCGNRIWGLIGNRFWKLEAEGSPTRVKSYTIWVLKRVLVWCVIICWLHVLPTWRKVRTERTLVHLRIAEPNLSIPNSVSDPDCSFRGSSNAKIIKT
jgi:hypothetical protein